MNEQWVLLHFGEAFEELSRSIQELEHDPDTGEAELEVAHIALPG